MDFRTIIATIGGVLIGVFMLNSRKRSVWKKLLEVLAGAFTSYILAEPLSMMLFGDMSYAAVFGFLTGLLGLRVAEFFFTVDKETIANIVKLINRK